MTWTSIWYGVAAFFEAIFKVLKGLGQGPNIVMWSIITILFFYQLMRINKETKQAKRDGTYP